MSKDSAIHASIHNSDKDIGNFGNDEPGCIHASIHADNADIGREVQKAAPKKKPQPWIKNFLKTLKN